MQTRPGTCWPTILPLETHGNPRPLKLPVPVEVKNCWLEPNRGASGFDQLCMPWCEKSLAVVLLFVPVPFLSLSRRWILRAVPERGPSHSSAPAISCVVHFLEWGAATDGQGRHAGVTDCNPGSEAVVCLCGSVRERASAMGGVGAIGSGLVLKRCPIAAAKTASNVHGWVSVPSSYCTC
ncbi:hypothetical protein B0J15DRAFT_108540 [Fusarium solani]|jgi:hypothetical protein|uniref:Uncharacterized protein n=1 Tax=Fusarium solani TaxID=169388 RepID=A0A9P9L492_FUSSL|nr:uncharacterized protein B0J15DRAFT_108540 [Fusarium solani]KAH7273732.1 hypothetical protein B0J15DRAFT_108540 [Fusarium solani]